MVLVRRCLSFQVTSLTRLWPALPKRSPASLLPYSIQLLSHLLIMAHWNHQYPQVNQQNTVSTPPLPTVANVHPMAPVQPLSLAPRQHIPSQSSVQPSLLEVPVCSLGAAAFVRVGEMTLVSSNKSNLPLQLDQLTKLVDSNNHVVAFELSFS